MNSKVTILDIAKESGISKSTVSRYLRGENVSASKIRKIEAVIEESGYIRNNVAQLLRTSKSNLIGVLIPDLDNPFFTKIVKRLEELAQAKNMTLIVKTFKQSTENEIKTIEFIRGFMVDALFLCRSDLDDSTLDSLKIDIPVISIDKEFQVVNSVVSNNYESSYNLTNHLFEHVNRNVMFFARFHESTSVLQRIAGYEEFCSEYNKEKFLYQYDKNMNFDDFFDDLIEYILNNQIEGIICRNDNEAIKVLSHLNDLYSKGEIRKIKVCGFDNIAISRNIFPKLTTIDQNIEKMCDLAFQIFLNYENHLVPKRFVHESELIVRESSI